MKIDASTLAKEEIKDPEIDSYQKVKSKSFKSLKPLFLPDIHKQILFQKAITLFNKQKINSTEQFYNYSLRIDNYSKKKNIYNKSSSGNNSNNNKNSFIRIINNRSIINKILPLNEINNICLDKNTRNDMGCNDLFNITSLKSIISKKGYDISCFSLSDKKIINRNFLFLKQNVNGKNIKPKYLFNSAKCIDNGNKINSKMDKGDEKRTKKIKLLNENKIKYYKWFI